MIVISTATILVSIALLWLSHRIYLTYTHVVAREERDRLRQAAGPVRASGHIGPRCFLVLDFVVLFVLIRVLESLAFDTTHMSELRSLFLAFTHFSGIVAFWLLIEGRHLTLFYDRIALAMGKERGQAGSKSFLTDFWARNLKLAFCTMVSLPLLLELVGVRVGEASRESLLLMFGICFVLPQIGLLAFLAYRIEPLRRRIVIR